ncbi:hypothetical protein QEZ40_003596 [Streptomyces katrae]|uniref:Transposase n=1 Tax=Streptomyces katrae TaxID=68223 RepID=A0ABT7GXU7_9ACTN|nr:hypothetical protein [Streptomyces katrae]MDK9498414.1 hypothetical protein [Streptomyces katrae]
MKGRARTEGAPATNTKTVSPNVQLHFKPDDAPSSLHPTRKR